MSAIRPLADVDVDAGPGSAPRADRSALVAAAALSAIAGVIHVAVTGEHFEHWWVLGLFFLVTGLGQLGYAHLTLRGPSTPLLIAGILANLGIVLIWVMSRTVGLPIEVPESPDDHGSATGVEEIGLADLAATACELGLIVVLVAQLHAPWRGRLVNGLLAVGLVLWALRLLGLPG